MKSKIEPLKHATMFHLFLHFITADSIIFAGILETPQLLYSRQCLVTGDL